MRILVTGGSGFIGRALVRQLAMDPQTEVAVLLRDQPQVKLPWELASLRTQIELVVADLRNYPLTKRAVMQARPECVIHLAAVGVTDPFLSVTTALRHNLHGTLNLLKACFEQPGGAQQFVTGRTPGELSAMNVYAASKAAAWAFCQMFSRIHQWPIQGAMIFQAYGPGQPANALIPAAIAAAQAGRDFPMTSGTQERDWIWVNDVASGLAAMTQSQLEPGQTIELGTGCLTSIAALVQQIYSLVNHGGRPLPGRLPDRPGEEPRQAADADATETVLNWRATTSLPTGLRQLTTTGDPTH